jgi:hypothetical protein
MKNKIVKIVVPFMSKMVYYIQKNNAMNFSERDFATKFIKKTLIKNR